MIDSKLNIDNLVMYEGKVLSVYEANKMYLVLGNDEYDVTYKDVDPIHLTPEALQAVGFEKRNDRWFNYKIAGRLFIVRIEEGAYLFRIGGMVISQITYIHELQNLYYVLTKKELDVTNLKTV